MVSDVAVTVRTRVTLPDWSGSTASEAEKAEWSRFCAALRDHEQGHVDLVLDRLSHVDQSLIGKASGDASKAWDDALNTLSTASAAYDDATDHGRNQGCVIDVSVGSASSDGNGIVS
jgi:predicted secreted Zn-dependent protease